MRKDKNQTTVVVKLQRPITTNGSYTNILSYVVDKNDRADSNAVEEELTQEQVDQLFDGYYKVYYTARYTKGKKLELLEPTRAEDWV